jgi:gliding motility-associated lipoprotein GldH
VNKFFYILVTFWFLVSCGDADIIYQNSKVIENNTWNKNEAVSFNFDINDTVEFYDFYFNLRTTNLYEWSNLYMFVEIGSPEEQFNIDTVEFVLANSVGEWTGISSGSIINNKILFISKKRFPALGTYKLTFNQAMRQDDLTEVMDAGIIIKKAVLK